MKRGEIYYVEPSKQYQETGSEQRSNRPAIIVSNDLNNENAQTVEVVYLTTQPDEGEKYKELEEKYNNLKMRYDMLATRWEILRQTYSDVIEQFINRIAKN